MEFDKDFDKKCCDNCMIFGFTGCKKLEENKKFLELFSNAYSGSCFNNIKHIKELQAFKMENACDDFKSKYIQYPLTINKINFSHPNVKDDYSSRNVGKPVRIKPCDKKYEGKTYLGIHLGDLPTSLSCSYKDDNKSLNVYAVTNPAIYVFDLGEIIFGYESWWGVIDSEEEVKEITTDEISNLFYVKLLRGMTQEDGE